MCSGHGDSRGEALGVRTTRGLAGSHGGRGLENMGSPIYRARTPALWGVGVGAAGPARRVSGPGPRHALSLFPEAPWKSLQRSVNIQIVFQRNLK